MLVTGWEKNFEGRSEGNRWISVMATEEVREKTNIISDLPQNFLVGVGDYLVREWGDIDNGKMHEQWYAKEISGGFK